MSLEEKTEDRQAATFWGIPIQYAAIVAIMVGLYFFDKMYSARAGDYDPRLVQVLERLTSIEQQIRFIDTKFDRDVGQTEIRIRNLEDWKNKHESESAR